MRFISLPLSGAFRVEIEPIGDARGFFARLFCVEEFKAHGLATSWAQCNMSYTANKGTLRGMHFQRPPSAETKLVRCLRGAVFDVLVDLRSGSPTFGQWHAEILDETNLRMLCIPEGFAHGFQTMTDDVELLYFHSSAYNAAHEGGVSWNDPSLGINWPLEVQEVSIRDLAFPCLDELEPISI